MTNVDTRVAITPNSIDDTFHVEGIALQAKGSLGNPSLFPLISDGQRHSPKPLKRLREMLLKPTFVVSTLKTCSDGLPVHAREKCGNTSLSHRSVSPISIDTRGSTGVQSHTRCIVSNSPTSKRSGLLASRARCTSSVHVTNMSWLWKHCEMKSERYETNS